MGANVAKSNPITAGIQDEHELNMEMAKREEQDAIYNAGQRRRQGERLMKEQVAAYGASGIELEGSAVDLIKQDLADAEQEAMNMVYSGKLRRSAMEAQSKMQRNRAYTGLGMSAGSLAFKGGA